MLPLLKGLGLGPASLFVSMIPRLFCYRPVVHIDPPLQQRGGDFPFVLTCLTSLMLLVGSWRHVDVLPHTAQKPMVASPRSKSGFTLGGALQTQLGTNAQYR